MKTGKETPGNAAPDASCRDRSDVVREEGLGPSRLAAQEPKSCASASSATLAGSQSSRHGGLAILIGNRVVVHRDRPVRSSENISGVKADADSAAAAADDVKQASETLETQSQQLGAQVTDFLAKIRAA